MNSLCLKLLSCLNEPKNRVNGIPHGIRKDNASSKDESFNSEVSPLIIND